MTLLQSIAATLILALSSAACDRGAVGASGGTSTGAAPTSSSAPTAGSSCDALVRKFDDELARAPGSCKADADCRCFPGGISTKRGCGGITDAATATRLDAIHADYGRAGCRSGIACAAWSCAPVCEAGRCINGSRTPK